ncbi:hypothetical protein G6Z92_06220 [Vibrio aestuarianus subsp. cardii]|uniref:conjugative transfer protein MobI(A/C) n=1 Tax=Vibrio aestuarianus TaxID=28171 RepID=UPI0015C53409|nr:conjugative transfer protein MobI(A/C) [Vibrio aestuarianus]NGZ66580.1 hypothetical protein [Vibrio aestuarianus subsp. cardii]
MTYIAIRDAIYAQIDAEYELARAVQELWMRKVAERELSRKKDASRRDESTNYEFRLEFNGASFNCRWIRVQFVKRGTKTIRVTKSIAIPKDGKYKISQFKYANEWESNIISQMEEALWPIRNSTKHLMKAMINVRYGAKSSGITLDSIAISDRVSPTTQSIQAYKRRLS